MTTLGTRGSIARSILGVLGASVLTAGLSLTVSVVIGRSMGPGGKGQYDLISAAAGFATIGFGLSLQSGIVFGLARSWIVRGAVGPIATLSALIVGLTTFLTASGLEGLVGSRFGWGVSAAIATMAAGQVLLLSARAGVAGVGEPARGAWLDVAGRIVGLALLVPVVREPRPVAFALAVTAGWVVSAVLELVHLGRPARAAASEIRAIVSYALPSYGANFIQFLNYRLDLFVLAAFRPTEEVGLYAIAGLAIQLLWMPAGAVASTLLPTVSAHADDSEMLDRVLAASRMAFAVTLACAAVGGAFAGVAIPLLYGGAFSSAALPLWLILPGAVLFSPAMVLASFFAGIGRVRYNLSISTATFAITLVLDLAFIPPLGMTGAAVASSIAYGSTTVLTFLLVRRAAHVGLRALLVPSLAELLAAGRILRGSGHRS